MLLCAQKVQLQLKAGEKTDKADESPVTVADYGMEQGCLFSDVPGSTHWLHA